MLLTGTPLPGAPLSLTNTDTGPSRTRVLLPPCILLLWSPTGGYPPSPTHHCFRTLWLLQQKTSSQNCLKTTLSGQCGSCWAFGAVGVTEGFQSMLVGRYTALSEQQVLDCSNAGSCNGGYHIRALNYIRNTNKLASNSQYRLAPLCSLSLNSTR